MNINRRNFLRTASVLSIASSLNPENILGLTQKSHKKNHSSKLKTSLNAYSFSGALKENLVDPSKGISLMELLDFCAANDFDAIDPTGYFFPGYPDAPTDEYINNFKKKAFKLGLDISGTGIKNDFASPDEKVRKEGVELAKKYIEVAAKLGAPVIRVFAGPIPNGYENKWNEVAEWMIDPLKECANYGEKFGILVGVQNHGDMIRTAEQALHFVNKVDSEWFGLIVDTGFFMTPDPYVDIEKVIPHAVNFQVKESPFGKESPVRIDLNRLVKILRKSGYRGYLPIETLSVDGKEYKPEILVPKFLKELKTAIGQTE